MIKKLVSIIMLGLIIQSTFAGITFIQSDYNKVESVQIQNKELNLKILGDNTDLEIGDLIFCDIKPGIEYFAGHGQDGLYNDHVAMYIEDGQIINAMPVLGVVIQDLSILESWSDNIVYGKVINANYDQRSKAVEWAGEREGALYEDPADPITTWDPEINDEWYCSELVWAAYYALDSFIDLSGAKDGWDGASTVYVEDLLLDDDIILQDMPFEVNIFLTYRQEATGDIYFTADCEYYRNIDSNFRWDFTNDGTYDTKWYKYEFVAHNYDEYEGDIFTIKVQVKNFLGTTEATLDFSDSNRPPNDPDLPDGSDECKTNKDYSYKTSAIDLDGDYVYYMFYWSDDTDSTWLGPYRSGEEVTASHSWAEPGEYCVYVQSKDCNGELSKFSQELVVKVNKPKSNSFSFKYNFFINYLYEILQHFFSFRNNFFLNEIYINNK